MSECRRFQIILTILSEDCKTVEFYERTDGASMVEVLSRFQIAIGKAMELLCSKQLQELHAQFQERTNDDIPF